MNVVIIEDEELAARRLEGMVREADPSIHVVARLESVEDAVDWFRTHPEPDLIFLDIHLEDGISFTIFEKVRLTSAIIFTTAFDEYAIKAFKLRSIDYLLKPVIQEDLNQAIRKYKDWNAARKEVIDVSALYELLGKRSISYRSRFLIPVGQKIKTVDISDVAYFRSTEGMTFLVCMNTLEYPLEASLDKLAEEVDPNKFFRINRQYLISLKSIANIHVFPKSKLKIELVPPQKEEIYVSLERITMFKRWLDGGL